MTHIIALANQKGSAVHVLLLRKRRGGELCEPPRLDRAQAGVGDGGRGPYRALVLQGQAPYHKKPDPDHR